MWEDELEPGEIAELKAKGWRALDARSASAGGSTSTC
jgi:hypothetical protein